MSTCRSVVAGYNLGGRRSVAMADLRDVRGSAGVHARCRTLLNSGNLVFESTPGDPARTGAFSRPRAKSTSGFRTDFHVRSAREWSAVVSEESLSRRGEERSGASHRRSFSRSATSQQGVLAIPGRHQRPSVLGQRPARVHVLSRRPGPIQANPGIIDKVLNKGTGRNWNTVTSSRPSRLLSSRRGRRRPSVIVRIRRPLHDRRWILAERVERDRDCLFELRVVPRAPRGRVELHRTRRARRRGSRSRTGRASCTARRAEP